MRRRYLLSTFTLIGLACLVLGINAMDHASAEGIKTIEFSGRTWDVSTTWDPNSSFSNSTEQVWTDSNGYLHLKLSDVTGTWMGVEIVSKDTFGYGTYQWVSDGIVDMDRNAVLGMFAYQDTSHEMDDEISRWGNSNNFNGAFTVQPDPQVGVTQDQFPVPITREETIHSITWSTNSVSFSIKEAGNTVRSFTVPVTQTANGSHAIINLWMFKGLPPSDGKPVEIVIKSFNFYPDSTWISDTAKNSSDPSAWDIAPAAGSNLVFNAEHTGQCTIDQNLSFGMITLASGSGTVVQGTVNFSYSNLFVNGGTWTGRLGNIQTCSGNLIVSGGTITSNVLSMMKTGSGNKMHVSGFNFYDLTIQGDTTILYDTAYVVHDFEIGPEVTVINEGGLVWMPSFVSETFVNGGKITGSGNLSIMTTGFSITASLGTISCPLIISLASWGGPSDTVSLSASANLGNLGIWSENPAQNITLDLKGHSVNASSISLARGGIVSSSITGAHIKTKNDIKISEGGKLVTTNVSLLVIPDRTLADDLAIYVMIVLVSVLAIAGFFILKRRKEKR